MVINLVFKFHRFLLTFTKVRVRKLKVFGRHDDANVIEIYDEHFFKFCGRMKTELFKKSFAYSGSVLWNGLPYEMRKVKNTYSFKQIIKQSQYSV